MYDVRVCTVHGMCGNVFRDKADNKPWGEFHTYCIKATSGETTEPFPDTEHGDSYPSILTVNKPYSQHGGRRSQETCGRTADT